MERATQCLDERRVPGSTARNASSSRPKRGERRMLCPIIAREAFEYGSHAASQKQYLYRTRLGASREWTGVRVSIPCPDGRLRLSARGAYAKHH